MRLFTSHFLPLLKSLRNEQEYAQPRKTKSLRGVITPEMYAALRKRNDARIQQTIKVMGTKWIGHKSNHIQRVDVK